MIKIYRLTGFLALLSFVFATSCEKPYEAPASYVSQSTTIPTTFEAGMFDPSVDQVVQVRVPVKIRATKLPGRLDFATRGPVAKFKTSTIHAALQIGGSSFAIETGGAPYILLNERTVASMSLNSVRAWEWWYFVRPGDSAVNELEGSTYEFSATIVIPAGTVSGPVNSVSLKLDVFGDTRWYGYRDVPLSDVIVPEHGGSLSIELQPEAEIIIKREGANDQIVTPSAWNTEPVSSI